MSRSFIVRLTAMLAIALFIAWTKAHHASLAGRFPGRDSRAELTAPHTLATVPISRHAFEHVHERHWPGSTATGAGKYLEGMSDDKLQQWVDEAVAKGRRKENTDGRPGTIYEYDLGTQIGVSIDGGPATRIRVVLNDRGQLVTAFPF